MGEVDRKATVPPDDEGRIALQDGARPRILLAEDSAAARILTAALLKRMGCDVDVVEHGEEALGLAQSTPYDLIILDIEMPVMDGVVAAREIRALGGTAGRTPIVALSALLADARKLNAWRDAFDAMLAKPASREKLRRVIADVLNPRPVAPPALAGEAEPVALVDFAALGAVRARISRVQWLELLDMAVAEMGELAGQMQAAQAGGDRGSVGRAARKLRGIASSFAAPRLARLAEDLEGKAADGLLSEMAQGVDGIAGCMEATAVAFRASAASAA